MNRTFKATVEKLEPGKLRGQYIATAKGRSRTVIFDVIEGLLDLSEGDKIEITVTDKRPSSLDKYDFCGHGYLAASKGEEELLSLWGILFHFKPAIGLEENVKYYLCIKREKGG